MFCSKCGSKVEDGVRFCPECGTPVGEPQAMPTQTPVQPQQYQQTAQTNMNAWQYFVSAVKKYAVFNGRARRAEFWWFFLFSALASIVASYIGAFLGMAPIIIWVDIYTPVAIGNILYILATIFFFLPGLAVGIRRMHDVGKSGWYYLIPIYNIVLAATAGNTGPNKYGPDPKGA
jgi:uncharacterized membrane protein YhaH (DUF805 family)